MLFFPRYFPRWPYINSQTFRITAAMPRTTCLLVVLIVVSAARPIHSQSTLEVGATLPSLQGQTLDDKDVSLPDAAQGRVCLVIMTFSKQAGERSRQWQEHFVKD